MLSDILETQRLQHVGLAYLLGGEIPSSDLVRTYANLNSDTRPLLNPRKPLSIEEYGSLLMWHLRRLEAQREAIRRSYLKVLDSLNQWRSFCKDRIRLLESLNAEATSALLAIQESNGYLWSYTENFRSLRQVDESRSSVLVDTGTGCARINPLGTQNTLKKLSIDGAGLSVASSIGSRSTPLISVGTAPLSAICDQTDRAWIAYTASPTSGNAQVSISVNLLSPIEVCRIELERVYGYGANGSVRIYVSENGIDYKEFGSAANLRNGLVFVDTKQKIRAMRIDMLKTQSDGHRPGTGYYYYFDIKELKAFTETSDLSSSTGTMFHSNEFDVQNFSQISLSVCEVLTEETDILYQIIIGAQAYEISPLERVPGSVPQILRLQDKKLMSNIEGVEAEAIVDGKSKLSLITVEDLATEDNLILRDASFWAVNTKLPTSISTSNIVVFKDYCKVPSVNQLTGWEDLGDNTYETSFIVEGTNPIVIDFGPQSIWVNRSFVNGRVTFIPGIKYTVEAKGSQLGLLDADLSSVAAIKSQDPLYPYNVRALIEGYQYSSSFPGEKVYVGVGSRFAKQLEIARSYADFLSSDNMFWIKSSGLSNYFLVHGLNDLGRTLSSMYLIQYNVHSSPESISLRAWFKTRNSDISPVLLGYTLKVG